MAKSKAAVEKVPVSLPAQTDIQVVNLDPACILADDNSRYGLIKVKVESMAQSILDQGGVMQPVEVEPLPEGAEVADGILYRLTAGFYRLAGIMLLNKEQNAGMLIPAIIHPVETAVERLNRQLAENMERQNQTPMDKAVAMKKLMDLGVPKVEVRKKFATIGGRKGNVIQMASNSYVNMHLAFLEFPKDIQAKIHDGRLGVADAQRLSRYPKEKWPEILQQAEEDRLHQIELEEKDEEKFLKLEAKTQADIEKSQKHEKDLAEAKAALETAEKLEAETKQTALKAYEAAKLDKGSKDDKEKDAKKTALSVAEMAVRQAEADAKKAKKDLEKLEGKKVQTPAEIAAERAKKLKEVREAATAKATAADGKKAKSIGPRGIDKAAVAVGASPSYVPLKLGEIRDGIYNLAIPGAGSFPKLQAIGKALESWIQGILTERQMNAELATITGEKKAKAS